MAQEVEEILEQRGSVYGDFTLNIHSRATIMTQLNQIHIEKTGVQLKPIDYQALNDLVIKLVRLAATPEHGDSWTDIVGYAKLNIERLTK